MIEPQTLSQVLARLEQEGYTHGLKADQNGSMRVFPRDVVVDPEDLLVEKIYRFEGDTNLDDEEIIFAICCTKLGVKGTYITAFGPKIDPIDAAMVQRLHKKYRDPQ